MEEEPQEARPALLREFAEDRLDREPHDPGDDDPDDPGYEDVPSSDSSEDSDNDNIREVARLDNNRLNVNVQLLQNLTKGEIIILELACAVRHSKTFESILDHFKNLNLLFGPKCFPESKTKLWSIILLNKAGIRRHVYCGRQGCGRYIARRDRINNDEVRCRCGYHIAVDKAKFFLDLDLRRRYF